MPPLSERIAWSEALNHDPRVKVTAFEAAFDVRFSADTLAIVRRHNPGIRFVWIMGADNLKDFHRWQNWRDIAMTFPIAVVDRPGATLSYLSSKMAKAFEYARIDEADASLLSRLAPPVWTFLHGPRSPVSSTAIRDGKTPSVKKA